MSPEVNEVIELVSPSHNICANRLPLQVRRHYRDAFEQNLDGVTQTVIRNEPDAVDGNGERPTIYIYFPTGYVDIWQWRQNPNPDATLDIQNTWQHVNSFDSNVEAAAA